MPITSLRRDVAVLAATVEERFKAQETALLVALETNEKRLDSLNDFRGALTDQTNRMMTRAEAISALESSNSRMAAEMETLRTKLDGFGRPNYVLSVTMISAIFGMIAGFWVVIGLKVDNSIAPVNVLVEQLRSTMTNEERQVISNQDQLRTTAAELATLETQNAQSITDRRQLNDRLHQIDETLPNIMADYRAQSAGILERVTRLEAWADAMRANGVGERSSGSGMGRTGR